MYGTLVDPIAIAAELGRVLGDSDGGEAARLWRLKQLEYSFRLTAMDRYEDFRWVTSRALDFALASLGVSLPDGQAQRLVGLYDHLQPFPDAVPALRALAGLGYELAVLSNGTPAMIANCLDNSRLAASSASGSAPTRSACSSRRLSCTGTRPGGCPRRSGGPAHQQQRVRLRRGQRRRDGHDLGEPLRPPRSTRSARRRP